ncbi:MAG TPA: response regulator transcription factor [Vicinamibacterales bacterium]|jgi:DNA-binding response OmpR family regulator
MTEPSDRARVLVVEDEESIRELICFHLDLAGHAYDSVSDGKAALAVAVSQPFDVVVLDVVLPGVDGITLCQAIRRGGPNREVPILMLSARRGEADRVLGLESGADDYLTKPFSFREFLARISALLRRPRSTWRALSEAGRSPSVSLLGIVVDPTRHSVTCDGKQVWLTPQEFNLLHLLMSNAGVVYSRDDLLARIWQGRVYVTARGVDTLVKRLRRKIEKNPDQPTRIVTVRGSGYKFAEVES